MQLSQWLEKNDIRQWQFAERLKPKRTQGQLSHYITGHTPIPLLVVEQVEKLTDGQVTAADWLELWHRTHPKRNGARTKIKLLARAAT
jgi:hypothetical protein